MSILYKLYPIKDTINKTPKQGLIAKAISRGTKNIDHLAKEISDGSTFNKAEVKALVDILIQRIENNIREGYSVNLEGLGTFFVSSESRMVQQKDEIRSASIKVKRITYRPSRKISNSVKGASFERYHPDTK